MVLPLIGCGASKDKDTTTSATTGATTHINAGVVTTLAGSTTTGSADGNGTDASFSYPIGLAVDSNCNVYVADTGNNMIRKITPAGVVTTLAGSTTVGYTNATGTAASFDAPYGVAVDSNGYVYVADFNNNWVRKITPAGVVTTLAGGINGPMDIAVDPSGNIYVTDFLSEILKITTQGVVTILPFSGYFNNSPAEPGGITVDSIGNVYATEGPAMISKITPAGVVTTLAGSSTRGNANDVGTAATFGGIGRIAVDSNGTLYVADTGNHMIRKIA
jgi:serine/threonine protein kinase, bacterial